MTARRLSSKIGAEERRPQAAGRSGITVKRNYQAEMEAEIEIEPFTIYMNAEAIRLSGNDIKALQGFVDFEE